MLIFTLNNLLFTAFALVFYQQFADSKINLSRKQLKIIIALTFLVTFLIKLSLAYVSKSCAGDLNTFKAWASWVHEMNFSEIYSQGIFLDYPPGYLYVLNMLESLRLLLNLEQTSVLFDFLLKLPAILADMTCGALIVFLCLKEKKVGLGIFSSLLYMLAPAVLLNSGAWGQIDGFYTLFLVVSLYLLYRNKILLACLVYGITLLIKPQALLFGPIFLFVILEKKDWLLLLKALLVGLLTILLVSLPFTKNLNFTWLITLYQQTMSNYSYLSVNAFNLYSFLGFNWFNPPANIINLLSFISISFAVILSGIIYFKSKHSAKIFLSSSALMFTIFMLAPKMHERYLFPVLLLILVSFIFIQDRRLLFSFLGVNCIHYFNVGLILLSLNGDIEPLLATDYRVVGISFLHLVVFVYFLWILYLLLCKKRTKLNFIQIPSFKKMPLTIQKSKIFTKITKKDVLLLFLIMFLYGSLSFYHLGSSRTANSFWQAKETDSSFILELEEETPIDKIYFLTGIGDATLSENTFQVGLDLSLEFSSDLVNWYPLLDLDNAYVYEWVIEDVHFQAKYVRIHAKSSKSVLNEIGFKKADSDSFVEISVWDHSNQNSYPHNPAAVIDEQKIIPLHPTFYNSTYFDEIYHARTGFELLHGYHAYENTHPPLGKILIASGISIFGMNPFGWRFAGVFFGILMLPFMYLLLKKMFDKTLWAAGGTFIFAFDFMHFTQSRIATIDTYAVFFILAMFYFMYQYFMTSFYDTNFNKTLRLLFYSGLFMGMGIASKWTVAYGAVGLAILFFINFIRRSLEYWQVYKDNNNGVPLLEDQLIILHQYKKRALITLLCCCIFFIVIPCLIYYASYLPFLNVAKDNYQFIDFIKEQQNMFSYHYNLNSSHPFSSPWWQWPLMIRPIWYSITYASTTGNGMISTIAAFGNPAIWWGSILSMGLCMRIGYLKKDRLVLFILIAFLAAYLPWVFVPRIVFIYHYYTAVPFLVLSLIYVFKYYVEQNPKFIRWFYIFIILVIVLFILFYPVLSGNYTWQNYVKYFLRWLPSWYF